MKDPAAWKAYREIPVMSLPKVRAVANMMSQINTYIIGEALLKIRLGEVDIPSSRMEPSGAGALTSLPVREPLAGSRYYADGVLLELALRYIQDHYMKEISLEEMAARCNISVGYCSRQFKKVTGDNFTAYLNKLRINKAKELPETSGQPVINISIDLGFEDCSYLLKYLRR